MARGSSPGEGFLIARTILTCPILGHDLVGTVHTPSGGVARRAGVLLLNAGPAPRAGNSDLYVRVADRLAERGFPVFRFDLPGLGDSAGRVPDTTGAFWAEVLAGRNDAATAALAADLKRRHELSALVVGGLCAAVIPALHAAAQEGRRLDGLLFLEPEFRTIFEGSAFQAFSHRKWLDVLTGESALAKAAAPMRPLLERSKAWTLPHDANVPCCENWRTSVARGTHSLVVVAEGLTADRVVHRVAAWLPRNAPGTVSIVRVPETNHLLTAGNARAAVAAAAETWMMERFGTA